MCRAQGTRFRSDRVAGCARARTACSARSRNCRGGRVGSAGLRPAPAKAEAEAEAEAEATATATATATAKAGIPWDCGAVLDCGDAVNPSLK
ncbi:hypothetical protein C7E14_09170 [Stenotrophomonas maltophilia]|nr:hypothetical protein C7E14_09170 [Stenotrophomonas maltophilia]